MDYLAHKKNRYLMTSVIAALVLFVLLLISSQDAYAGTPSADGSCKAAYNTLSDTQKSLYDSLKSSLNDFVGSEDFLKKDISSINETIAKGTYVGSLSSAELTETYIALNYDNPQFFFLDNAYVYLSGSGSGYLEAMVSQSYLKAVDRSRTAVMIEDLSGKWVTLLSEVYNDGDSSDNDTDDVYDISLRLHDLILKRIDYAHDRSGKPESSAWAHCIGGVFTGDGVVCEGYAKAFSYILNRLGIDNILCVGFSKGEAHAWNSVKIGDKYYYVDSTWDDRNNGSDESAGPLWGYDFFCAPASSFLTDHSLDAYMDRYSDVQFADDDTYTYYNRHNSYSAETITSSDAGSFCTAALAAAAGGYMYYCVPDVDSIRSICGYLKVTGGISYFTGYSGLVSWIKRDGYEAPADPTCEDPGASVEPPADSDADFLIWAGGSKDTKKVTLAPTIEKSDYTDKKGKTKKGKLVYIVKESETTISFDSDKHTVITKSDKKLASVSGKGVVTAKKPGRVYVYACDTGSMRTEKFVIDIHQAPSKVSLYNVSGSTSKDNLLKKSYLVPGTEGKVFIVGTAKNAVDGGCSYDIQYKTDADKELMGVSTVRKDSFGNLFFICNAIQPKDNNGKYSTVKIDVICKESGKKASLTVYIGNPVNGMDTPQTSEKLEKKGDSVTLNISPMTALGKSLTTTDKLKIYVGKSYVRLSGKKVTADKGATVKASYNKSTGELTLKAGKDAGAGAVIYMAATNSVIKETTLYPLYKVTAEGAVEPL